MNLKEWATATGGSYATARRRYESGTLPVPSYRMGRLIKVGEPVTGAIDAIGDVGQTVVYAWVSSADQTAGLDGQVARVIVWATGQRLGVDRVVTEAGSALNGNGEEFLAVLWDPCVSTIVVERRDRFARFGAEYVEAALSAQGRRLPVVDPGVVDDDLVGDVTEVLTLLCARLSVRRGEADRARRAVEAAAEDPV